MLKYSGYAKNNSEIQIALIGDGAAKSVAIDLAASPFCVNFAKGVFPSGYLVRKEDGEMPSNVVLNGTTLTLVFANPPPPPNEGTWSPRTQMVINLSYSGATLLRKKGKRRY